MESASWHGPEYNAGDEVLHESRHLMLELAHGALDTAVTLTRMGKGGYISLGPLEIEGHKDVYGIQLTRDGERPFKDEDKERIKLYFKKSHDSNVQDEILPIDKSMVWVKEYREGQEREYVLTEYSFQPYAAEVDDLRDDMYSLTSSSERSQLEYFRERLERFKPTPFEDL